MLLAAAAAWGSQAEPALAEGARARGVDCPVRALRDSSLWPTGWGAEVAAWVRDPGVCALVSGPVSKAHQALRRAQAQWKKARHSESELLEGLAEQWHGVARDLVRAVAAEREAADLEARWVKLETELARVLASLEQLRAHIARLEAGLRVEKANEG